MLVVYIISCTYNLLLAADHALMICCWIKFMHHIICCWQKTESEMKFLGFVQK